MDRVQLLVVCQCGYGIIVFNICTHDVMRSINVVDPVEEQDLGLERGNVILSK